jgi:hypothetical protein
MARLVELVTIGTEECAKEVALGVQVEHRNLSTMSDFQYYWENISKSVYVALFVPNSDASILPSVLNQMNGKHHQVIGIFIPGETSSASTQIAVTVYHVPEPLITYKINATIARFLELECLKQLDIGRRVSDMALEELRKQIIRFFSMNAQVLLDAPFKTIERAHLFGMFSIKFVTYY